VFDPNSSERRKPSLLDRLSDDDPGEQRESVHARFVTNRQLRESVVRDLAWLLNSVRLTTVQDLAAFPRAAKSVLNFGLPDLAGRTLSSIDLPTLEAELRQAIVTFEPRLLPHSVDVQVASDTAGNSHNSLQFTIQAELAVQPVPLSLLLRTDIDLESGEVNVTEWTKDPPQLRA
jgi:type VI secretion system protein ImpF